MGLEQAINENTLAINDLIGRLNEFQFGTEVKPKSNPVNRKKRRTNKEIEADNAAKAKKEDPLGLDSTPPAPPAQPVTIDQLKAEASAVVDLDDSETNLGVAEAQKILNIAGYKKISDVPEDRRSKIVAQFREAVRTWNKK